MNKTFAWSSLFVLILLCSAFARAGGFLDDNLRRETETLAFGFQTAEGKTVAVCVAKNGEYIVYRFGTKDNVELQYPDVLDASSWQKFTFRWYHRGLGPQNGAMDENLLIFENGGYEYTVYDNYYSLNDRRQPDPHKVVGIRIAHKPTDPFPMAEIAGGIASRQGSLWALRERPSGSYSGERLKRAWLQQPEIIE